MRTVELSAPIVEAQGKGRRIVAIAVVAAGLLALPSLAEVSGNQAFTSLATRMLIFGIAAASLNLVLGYGGLVSFGHAAFFGIGGYTVGIIAQASQSGGLVLGVFPPTNQFLVVLLLAIVVSGVAAAIIGALSLRTSGVQFIMITLAFAQMVFFLFVSLKVYGGSDGMSIRSPGVFLDLNLRDRNTMYYIVLIAAGAVAFLYWRIVHSRFGRALIGLRQSERRMAAMGVPAYRYRLVISGMGGGLAGALMATFMRYVSPDMLAWTGSGELMIMIILGGVGTLAGPFVGAALLVLLESWLSSWTEDWQLGVGLILLVVVLFTHGGLRGLYMQLAGKSR